jgi:hypothetical protein
MADQVAKGRSLKGERNPARLHPDRLARGARNGTHTHPESVRRGEEQSKAKLDWESVREIRRRYAAGNASQRSLAKEYDVAQAQIYHVVHHHTWKEEGDVTKF